MAVLVVLSVFLFLYGGRQNTPVRESVLGLEVGSNIVQVAQKFDLPQELEWSGNPWQLAASDATLKTALGTVLKTEDLGDASTLAELKTLSWSNGDVLVVLRNNEVRAIVVRSPHRAVTGPFHHAATTAHHTATEAMMPRRPC